MTTLFDLIGYQVPAQFLEDGDGDYEDPAYITPPHHHDEPERRSPLERVMRIIEMCTQSMTADTPIRYSNLQTVAWSEIRILDVEGESELSAKLTAFFNQFFGLVGSFPQIAEPETTAIAPQHCAIDGEISTKNEPFSPPPKAETPKGRYTEEKVIRKNGKVVGVYQYERWRENGKLKSKYLGCKPKQFAP